MRKLFYEGVLDTSNNGKIINWVDSIGRTVHFIYDDIEDDITMVDYDKKKSIVTYAYHNITYSQYSTALKNCQLSKMLFNEFKYNVDDILSNKDKTQSIQITDREIIDNGRQRLKIYKYKCMNCGFKGEKSESDLQVTWCPCCCSSPKVVIKGINDIPTIAPWMVSYFQGGYEEARLYNCSSSKKIYPICPLCGKVKENPIAIHQIYNTKSIGCICGDGISYPNKVMHSILSQLNIDFISEYTEDWLGLSRFDFCIPHLMVLIEMDGNLGHGKNIFNASKMTKCEVENERLASLNKDNFKDSIALEHGYKVIRISSSISEIDYIKENVLNSELSEYLDLSNIDWKMSDEFALKNLVKETCSYYKQHMNKSYEFVANKFHISKCTVGRYLKRGLKVSWITDLEYKNILKNNKKHRETYVYDLNFNLLNKFTSASELVKNSKEIFGVQFSSGGITKAVKNHTKYYDKYYISYSDLSSEEIKN